MLRNAKAWLFKKPVWLFPIITVWPLKVLLHSKYYFILAKKINCSGVTEITCLMQCSRLRGFSSRSFDSSQRVFSTSFEDFWQDVVSKKTNLYGMDFSENAHKQTTHIWKYRTYIANNGHLSTNTASVFFSRGQSIHCLLFKPFYNGNSYWSASPTAKNNLSTAAKKSQELLWNLIVWRVDY